MSKIIVVRRRPLIVALTKVREKTFAEDAAELLKIEAEAIAKRRADELSVKKSEIERKVDGLESLYESNGKDREKALKDRAKSTAKKYFLESGAIAPSCRPELSPEGRRIHEEQIRNVLWHMKL